MLCDKVKIIRHRCAKRIESRFLKKKVLPSCRLTVFILRIGQWKSTQANKDGSQSPNLGNWTVILLGDSWKNWRVYIPPEYFTQSFTNAAILIQLYFDLCKCWVARAQHALVHICLKIMLVDSSAMERKLPLQFISSSFMTHSLFLWFCLRH